MGYYNSTPSLEFRGDSSLLHNTLVPFHLANYQNYDGLYVGFDDGLFRIAPFGPVDSVLGYATKKYGCVNSFGTFSDIQTSGRACTTSECKTESEGTCKTCDSLPFKYGYDPR